MNKIDRYKILIRYLVKNGVIANQKELGRLMGYSNESAFSQIINQKTAEPKDFISRLQAICPSLNIEWLQTGEGNMLLGDGMQVIGTHNTTVQENSNNINGETARFIALLEKKDEQIDRLLSIIESQTQKQ